MKEKYDENKVIIAFSNVKEDILGLKNEIKFIKSELLEIKNKMELKKEVSTGNDGVQATTLQQPYNNLTTQFKQSSIEKLDKTPQHSRLCPIILRSLGLFLLYYSKS